MCCAHITRKFLFSFTSSLFRFFIRKISHWNSPLNSRAIFLSPPFLRSPYISPFWFRSIHTCCLRNSTSLVSLQRSIYRGKEFLSPRILQLLMPLATVHATLRMNVQMVIDPRTWPRNMEGMQHSQGEIVFRCNKRNRFCSNVYTNSFCRKLQFFQSSECAWSRKF